MLEGRSYEQFVEDYNAMCSEMGVTATNPWHLETVFRTNTSNALSVGRYQQSRDPIILSMRPYWQFRTVGDDRVTEICAPLNGLVFEAEDAFWATHYPPNHFNCRSTVVTLSERQVEARGLDVQRATPSDAPRPAPGFATNPGADPAAI